MSSTLYFKTPLFNKKRWEEKIVNEMNCQLYKIAKRQRCYTNDECSIFVKPRITIVVFNTDNEKVKIKAMKLFLK